MKCDTTKAIIKTGKVSSPELTRRSRRAQQRRREQLAKATNLSGGERHYDMEIETPEQELSREMIEWLNGQKIQIKDDQYRTIRIEEDIDREAAYGAYGLIIGRKPTKVKPKLDEAERSTKVIDHTEPDTVRPKAPRLSEKVDRAGHRGARRSTGKVLDPIHTQREPDKAIGLFRKDGQLDGRLPEGKVESFDEAVTNAPFKMPRNQPNYPRGERHTVPMDSDSRIYADPVRLRMGDTMVEDFDKRARPEGYEHTDMLYAISKETGKVELMDKEQRKKLSLRTKK